MTAPPAPFVPPDLQGRPAVSVLTAYFGDSGEGAKILAPLRAFGDPPVDLVRPMQYLDLQAITDAGNPPGRRNYWTSDLLTDLPDKAIDALVERANAATSPASVTIVAPYGGAVAEVPEDAVPIGGRSAPWFYHCYGIWTDHDDGRHIRWVRATTAAMRPWTKAVPAPGRAQGRVRPGQRVPNEPERTPVQRAGQGHGSTPLMQGTAR